MSDNNLFQDKMEPFRRLMKAKETAYRKVFGGEMGKIVLADLRSLCYVIDSSFSSDPLEMARREGRREVFNRIATFLNVDVEDIYQMNEEIYD